MAGHHHKREAKPVCCTGSSSPGRSSVRERNRYPGSASRVCNLLYPPVRTAVLIHHYSTQEALVQGLAIVFFGLMVFVFPALCIGKIATKLGRSGIVFGLLAAIPLGLLVALGLLAMMSG